MLWLNAAGIPCSGVETVAPAAGCFLHLPFPGWRHRPVRTVDPNPRHPRASGPWKPTRTNVPGTIITEKMPLLARMMDRVAIVRSWKGASGGHDSASAARHERGPAAGAPVLPQLRLRLLRPCAAPSVPACRPTLGCPWTHSRNPPAISARPMVPTPSATTQFPRLSGQRP